MNPFPGLLVDKVQRDGSIAIDKNRIGLFFPIRRRKKKLKHNVESPRKLPIYFQFVFECLDQGLPPCNQEDEWNVKACERFCKQRGLLFGVRTNGDVVFALRN